MINLSGPLQGLRYSLLVINNISGRTRYLQIYYLGIQEYILKLSYWKLPVPGNQQTLEIPCMIKYFLVLTSGMRSLYSCKNI